MTEHGLSQRQIFGVIRKNLEAKALKQFDEFHDEATLLEYAVAVLVRNALVLGDYSFFLKEQICEVFFTAKPNEAMRKFFAFSFRTFQTRNTIKLFYVCLRIKHHIINILKPLVNIANI